jgi:hypothetical protein
MDAFVAIYDRLRQTHALNEVKQEIVTLKRQQRQQMQLLQAIFVIVASPKKLQ